MVYDKEKKSIVDFFHVLTKCGNNTTLEYIESNGIAKPKDALIQASNYIFEIDDKPKIKPFNELTINDNDVSFSLNITFIALLSKAMTWQIDDVLNHPENDTVRVILKPQLEQQKASFFNAKNVRLGVAVAIVLVTLVAVAMLSIKSKPIDYRPFITNNLQTLFPSYEQLKVIDIEKAEQENSYNVIIAYNNDTGADISKTVWVALHDVNSGSKNETSIVFREFKELPKNN